MQPNQQQPYQEEPITPQPNQQPTPDIQIPSLEQPVATPKKSGTKMIFLILMVLLVIGGGVTALWWWQSSQQKDSAKQEVAAVVQDYFEAARQNNKSRLSSLTNQADKQDFMKSYYELSQQIGRECKSEPENATISSSNSQKARLETSCLPKQVWVFELARTNDSSWKIESVEGTNLVPSLDQALGMDPFVNISIYDDENKPKDGSCLVSDDAALFNGTSLPRDPYIYFYDETVLFETRSLKYFPAEKAIDQFDALERFYRLTSKKRYHFVITPQSYASSDKTPVLKLASDRAEAVQESMLKRGIPRARIIIENPVDEERTTAEQARGVKINISASRDCKQ